MAAENAPKVQQTDGKREKENNLRNRKDKAKVGEEKANVVKQSTQDPLR